MAPVFSNIADEGRGRRALTADVLQHKQKRRKMKHLTPRMLDWATNGVEVFIRRRPKDGLAYATTYDYSRFVKEPPLEVLRVRVPMEDIRGFEPETHPQVMAALRRHAATAQ